MGKLIEVKAERDEALDCLDELVEAATEVNYFECDGNPAKEDQFVSALQKAKDLLKEQPR